MVKDIKKLWWMCTLEEEGYWRSPDWELVHDGQRNPCQFDFPSNDIRCFTRKYRRKHGYGFLNGITFKYDLRNLKEGDHRVAEIISVEFAFEDTKRKKGKETFEMVKHTGGV